MCNASFNCKNLRESNSDTVTQLHNLRFVTCPQVCVLCLPQQWKHCTKRTQLFLFHFSRHTHSSNSLLMSQGRLDGKETLGCSVFAFSPVVIFSISTWLIQRHMSEREYNRAFWSFIFPKMLVSSFCVQASPNSNGRHGRAGLWVRLPSEEPFDLVLALGLAEFPGSVVPLESVPTGHPEHWIHSLCVCA